MLPLLPPPQTPKPVLLDTDWRSEGLQMTKASLAAARGDWPYLKGRLPTKNPQLSYGTVRRVSI